MERIVKTARDAAEQQARIKKRDASQCEAQLARNRAETEATAHHQAELDRISDSVRQMASL